MTIEEPKKLSTRGFTKRVLVGNMMAAWVFIFYALYKNQIGLVLSPLLSFMGVLFTLYTGVGHMDYRKLLENVTTQLKD